MATVIKSLSGDFGGSVELSQLQNEIVESSITSNVQYISRDGDTISIVFDATLSGPDSTTLDSIIASHTPTFTPRYNHIVKFVPKSNQVSQTVFKREDTLIYQGTNSIGSIGSFQAICYMDPGVTSYTIRIYDKTHDAVIAESTFTNTTEDIMTLTPIQNVPESEAVLELLAKKTGGKRKERAYIDSVTMYLL